MYAEQVDTMIEQPSAPPPSSEESSMSSVSRFMAGRQKRQAERGQERADDDARAYAETGQIKALRDKILRVQCGMADYDESTHVLTANLRDARWEFLLELAASNQGGEWNRVVLQALFIKWQNANRLVLDQNIDRDEAKGRTPPHRPQHNNRYSTIGTKLPLGEQKDGSATIAPQARPQVSQTWSREKDSRRARKSARLAAAAPKDQMRLAKELFASIPDGKASSYGSMTRIKPKKDQGEGNKKGKKKKGGQTNGQQAGGQRKGQR